MARRRALAALLWTLACMIAVRQASSQGGECVRAWPRGRRPCPPRTRLSRARSFALTEARRKVAAPASLRSSSSQMLRYANVHNGTTLSGGCRAWRGPEACSARAAQQRYRHSAPPGLAHADTAQASPETRGSAGAPGSPLRSCFGQREQRNRWRLLAPTPAPSVQRARSAMLAQTAQVSGCVHTTTLPARSLTCMRAQVRRFIYNEPLQGLDDEPLFCPPFGSEALAAVCWCCCPAHPSACR